MNFKNLFERKQTKYEKILPEATRYALANNAGNFNKEDIEVLLNNNFENEAFYLSSKALSVDPIIHKEFIEKCLSNFLNKDNVDILKNKQDLKNIVENDLKKIDDCNIKAVKLAQVSRQGFEFWQERFKEVSKELSENEKQIYLLAHTTLLGLRSFAEYFSEKNKDLNILIPEWINENKENIGYKINFENKNAKVNFLDRSSEKNGSIIVDDTIKTGETFNKIKALWESNGSVPPETRAAIVG